MNLFENLEKEKLIELYNYFESLRDESQLRKLGEEYQELIVELAKHNARLDNIKDIASEIADNFILLLEHASVLGINDEMLKSEIDYKYNRTLARKASKYYEK